MHILSQRHKCVIPVLKSDAYGLGLVPVARILEKSPAVRMMAVAQVLEGAALREAGIKTEILVLGGTLPRQWAAAAELGLTLTVTRPGMVAELETMETRQCPREDRNRFESQWCPPRGRAGNSDRRIEEIELCKPDGYIQSFCRGGSQGYLTLPGAENPVRPGSYAVDGGGDPTGSAAHEQQRRCRMDGRS